MIPLAALMVVFSSAGIYRVYEKAGVEGWKSFIPVYNAVVFLRICGRPDWWIFLAFVPLLNIAIGVVTNIDLARRFGEGPLFGAGLTLLPFVFYPILGFGDAFYHGSGDDDQPVRVW